MNLIKHIANLLALWTVPFVFVLFFMLVTGFAFTYNQAISSEVFIIMNTIYTVSTLLGYMILSDDEDCQSIKLFKTN
jgi:hypothetical protein